MILHRPFEAVAPTLDGDVLLVLGRAETAFTGGDLARLIPHASEDGVRKAAQRLVAQGLVTLERVGRAYNYRLNREHLVADAVLDIARARERLGERVQEHVRGWAATPESVLLFGSAARGEMRADSNLDLLVVADHDAVADEDVDGLATAVSAWTGNDARVVHLSPAEVRDAFRAGDDLMTELLAEGQVLHGPARYLQQVRREAAS